MDLWGPPTSDSQDCFYIYICRERERERESHGHYTWEDCFLVVFVAFVDKSFFFTRKKQVHTSGGGLFF